MKNARQQKILELVENYDIDTQETLLGKLAEEGYSVTQTTISRDIRQLKLVKGMTSKGTYKYVIPQIRKEAASPVLSAAITDSIIAIVPAQNIVIVKTLSGMANAMAVCIDSLDHEEAIGSVAGDDTIMIVTKNSEDALALATRMKKAFDK